MIFEVWHYCVDRQLACKFDSAHIAEDDAERRAEEIARDKGQESDSLKIKEVVPDLCLFVCNCGMKDRSMGAVIHGHD